MSLNEAIAKAALDVGGALSADKRHEKQGYFYISTDKILSVCGQALFNAQVMLIPGIDSSEVNAVNYQSRDGHVARYEAKVSMTMHLYHGDEHISVPWIGFGVDYSSPDKALYKAITGGHKYFLMKLLCVGIGNEDGEHEDQQAPQAAQQAKAADKPWTFGVPQEVARNMKSNDGKVYWSMSEADLNKRLEAIRRTMDKTEDEKVLDDLILRTEVIRAILDYRKEG